MNYLNIDKLTLHHRTEVVDAHADWVRAKVKDGWLPYFMTTMFHQLRGGTVSITHQMRRALESIYSRFVTRVVKDPNSERGSRFSPILIGCPDLPVHKHAKQSIGDFEVNGGLHHHAILLTPAQSRLKVPADQHFTEQASQYLRQNITVRSLTVMAITDDPGYVTDYSLKGIKSGRISPDDLIILPRTTSEMRH